jgi:hypothetical protein
LRVFNLDISKATPGVLRISTFTLAWLSLATVGVASAASPAVTAAETQVQLGVTAGYADYEENVFPQDTETGAILGFKAGVRALTPSGLGPEVPDLYTDIGYDFSAGFLTYKGNLQSPGYPPYRASDDAYYNTAIVRLGLGAPLNRGLEIIPYLAGGYQNWYRNVGGPGGYGELYQAGLIGGGIKLDFATSPVLVLQASAEGFAVIGGSVAVPSQNFSGDFGNSAEERVALDADYRLTNAWHAFAGLGVTHYEYTGSKPGLSGNYEPLSTTLEINSLFGVAYGF